MAVYSSQPSKMDAILRKLTMRVQKLTEDNDRLAVQMEVLQELLEQGSIESTRNTEEPLYAEPFV